MFPEKKLILSKYNKCPNKCLKYQYGLKTIFLCAQRNVVGFPYHNAHVKQHAPIATATSLIKL